MSDGKTYAETALAKHSMNTITAFPQLSQFLWWFPKRDETLTHNELNKAAYEILPENQFPVLANFFAGTTFDTKAAKWEFYASANRLFALYLRPVLLTVPFVFYQEGSDIIKLMSLLKKHYSKGKTPASLKLPVDIKNIIPKHMMSYLKIHSTNDQVNPHLFEFFVYQKMYHHLDRGWLCCNDSIVYSNIDCDLVDEALVDDAEKIAKEFCCPKIPIYCDQRLDEAIKTLDETWDRTTKNIGTNPGINIKTNSSGQQEWSLLYDSSESLDDSFFKNLPKLEIADIIMFVGDHVGIWEAFTHIKGSRYIKRKKPIPLAITACLMSEAFGFNETKMAEMSDVNVNLLQTTRADFIHVDSLCTASDMLGNYIRTLPVFKSWNLIADKILADADGQKIAATDNTIQSRYSKKYLGKDKGISLYTLIANHFAVNAKNMGPNEYEGHSLYDMVYGNKTDIDIDMVTGDNHSLNKLNFVALDSIDVDYVPNIKNIKEAAEDLYSIKSPDHYTGLLRPKNKININRIKSQKRGILRVLLSLIMQENTQSNIIRKLNSHARYIRLKAGLFEYNKIFKSIHVLNMIDNMQLRKAIRTARNRTEAYHQLQGLIRKIYNGIFKGKRVISNRISAHATRLIANFLVIYNAIILNAVYEKLLRDNAPQEIIKEFTRISPIAWIHILFTGRYNFRKVTGKIDITAIVHEVEKYLKNNFLKNKPVDLVRKK